MIPLYEPSLFSVWDNPVSGVDSYVLTRRISPIQQSFYFTSPSVSAEGRYYMFYAADPPTVGHTLGCVDFLTGEVYHIPGTQFRSCVPYMDLVNNTLYWSSGVNVWKRGLGQGDVAERVSVIPASITRGYPISSVATHFTQSADHHYLNMDFRAGNEWQVGRISLDEGDVELWQSFPRAYKHSQFSPTDPDLMLIAQDFYQDYETGISYGYSNRLWTIRKGEPAQPVFSRADALAPTEIVMVNAHTGFHSYESDPRSTLGHEWWSADGQYIWYVHYGRGVGRVKLDTLTPELLWALPRVTHAHADSSGQYLVADNIPEDDPDDQRIIFFNRKTGKTVNIVSALPDMAPWPDEYRKYHVHPHPHFCAHDALICYTTTVTGRPDVAFVKVDTLIEATS